MKVHGDFVKDWNFHCGILGIPPEATPEQIKKAYRENASLLHPDKHDNSELAKRKFQQLQDSYQYLCREQPKKSSRQTSTQQENGRVEHKQPTAARSRTLFQLNPLVLLALGWIVFFYYKGTMKPHYCAIVLRSSPSNAAVFDGDRLMGVTPMIRSSQCNSSFLITLKKAGHSAVSERVVVNERLGEFFRVLPAVEKPQEQNTPRWSSKRTAQIWSEIAKGRRTASIGAKNTTRVLR